MLNDITIMGRLTRDPELRTTTTGVQVASFTVAVDRDFSEKDKRVADFFDCVAWKHNGEFISKYFKKGSAIAVNGSMQSRKWDGKDGSKHTAWELIVRSAYFVGEKTEAKPADPAPQFKDLPDDEAELPF